VARVSDGVVIVGASAAGLSAADGLREGGYTGPLTVLDEEFEPGYDRPMLSKSLLAAEEQAVPAPLRSEEQLAARNIIVDHRGDSLRIGFGIYHDDGDALRLAEALNQASAATRPA